MGHSQLYFIYFCEAVDKDDLPRHGKNNQHKIEIYVLAFFQAKAILVS